MEANHYICVVAEPLNMINGIAETEMFKFKIPTQDVKFSEIQELLDMLVEKYLVSPFLYNIITYSGEYDAKGMRKEHIGPTIHLGAYVETLDQIITRNSLRDAELILNMQEKCKTLAVRSNTIKKYVFFLEDGDEINVWRPNIFNTQVLPKVSLELLRGQYK